MDPTELTRDLEILWIWVAAPITLLAAIVVTVRLRAPQVTRIGEAFRALRAHDPKSAGTLHPAAATALSMAASYGAAGAVGAATAVSLGGAGAVAWVWLFAILLAPLRMAEAALARTAPPGRAGAATGSLAGRLLIDHSGPLSGLGWALLILLPLAGFAFVGGVHGGAVTDAAEQLLPGSALALGLTVAGAAALFALVPARRAGGLLGWIGAVALLVFFAVALTTFFSEPGRAFGALGRALRDAMEGAPSVAAFSGATAGEIAFAAMLHVLPPVAAAGGVDGAIHAEAQAAATKRHASAALLGPLAYGLIATLLGLGFVATGSFHRAVEGERPLAEVTAYHADFDTVSQRQERGERLFTGFYRVAEGSTGVVETHFGTERGMIRAPRFLDRGEPAELMLRYRAGEIVEMQRKSADSLGAFRRQPLSALDEITIEGRMLPRGGRLLAESMTRGAGPIMARVGLAALLLLAALGAAAWGLGLARTLRSKLPEKGARFAALIPALGVAVAALGVIPRFGMFGAAIAALLTIVTSLALIARAAEARRITE